jgi:ubiquinone/menaquinone biosynthesis C-methylase UbiE
MSHSGNSQSEPSSPDVPNSERKSSGTAESMRRDWDARARRNAFLYIASWRNDWNEDSFFASGEQDYLRLVEPVLEKLSLNPSTRSMAELGCGAGRMTRSFAKRFRTVTAVDISAEMQARAKNYLGSFPNIRWVLSDGETLSGIESGTVDFVFSYLVLQHMPSKAVVYGAIQEMMRVLAPGGAFLFQFNGSHAPTMNWNGRFISGVLDGLCSFGLKKIAQSVASAAGIDPEMVGATWRGAALTSAEIAAAARSGGGVPADFLDADTPLAWCYGSKATESQA